MNNKWLDNLNEIYKKTVKKIKDNYYNYEKVDQPKQVVKSIGYVPLDAPYNNDRSLYFEYPEWDFQEIKDAAIVDSYIKRSIQKYSQLMFRSGYKLQSQNDTCVDYLKKRLNFMSFCTGTPFDLLIQGVAEDLICFSNAYLVKTRQDIQAKFIKAKGITDSGKPVAGYFRIDPATISIKRDRYGRIKKYRQNVNGREKLFNPEDIVHFYIDREAGKAYGTPRLVSVLEDVRLLRKLEANTLGLVYRYALPLYQAKIGLPQAGMQATQTEIDRAKMEIQKMAPDGMFVTNERFEIKVVGADGAALDISQYLTYFEKRVFTALNVSEATMGRSSNSNADSMEAQEHETVKFLQRQLSILVDNEIFNELLLEGGFNPLINEKDVVNFICNEINNDTKVKMENHELLKYQSNLITLDEARNNIGLRSNNMDESRLYANLIEQENTLEQIRLNQEGAERLAKISASQSSTTSDGGNSYTKKNTGNGKTSNSGKQNKAAKNNNMPQNQHGTYSAKVKEKNDFYNELVIIYNDTRNIVNENHDVSEINKLNKAIYKKLQENKKLDKKAQLDRLTNDLSNSLNVANTEQERNIVFGKFKYRLKSLI